MIRLSIIIPAYNAEPYIYELLRCLDSQITKEVEVIVIDDGSRAPVKTDFKWCKVCRQENKGCSSARNAGIDKAKGEYISFIDADDLVSEDFVEKILEKTKSKKYDLLEFSWKSLNKNNWCCDERLKDKDDRLPNPSVCTRVFKRSFIGETRFNVNKDSTEDEDFSRRLGYLDHEKCFDVGIITDYLYFYRDDVPMSKTKKFAEGLMNTKKVVYYYDHVTKDMTWLLDEIKKEDEVNEVWLMTRQCDLEGLDRWCRIIEPKIFWGHILKGDKYRELIEKKPPFKAQVIIYRRNINTIGGLRTFIRHFIEQLKDNYDITLLCRTIDKAAYEEFVPQVRIIADTIRLPNGNMMPLNCGGSGQSMLCDSLIILSFLDPLPLNVSAKQIVRMCHACKTDPTWELPKDYDRMLFVSATAMNSFGIKDGEVLHNFVKPAKDKALILVSATRFPAPDKGDLEPRMRKLCRMLTDKDIPFMWFNFSDGKLSDPPKNFYNMGVSEHMTEIIKAADYLVQLSDSECWSYSCLEALVSGTAIICTPFPSAFEMGIKDKVNAHIVPFTMDFDVEELLDIPTFTYSYDTKAIKDKWMEILGKTKPRKDYQPEKQVLVEVLQEFVDMMENCTRQRGLVFQASESRARQIMKTNPELIRIIGG